MEKELMHSIHKVVNSCTLLLVHSVIRIIRIVITCREVHFIIFLLTEKARSKISTLKLISANKGETNHLSMVY